VNAMQDCPVVRPRRRGLSWRVRKMLRQAWGKVPLPCRLSWGGWWLARDDDVIGRHVRRRDGFEEGEQLFVQRYLRPGMTVLDVGAHHGLYSVLASRLVGAAGRVVAFEPSPRERRMLHVHLRLNRCRNVEVVPSAVGDGPGEVEFFICLGIETGCNSLRPPNVDEPIRRVHVCVDSLDAHVSRLGVGRVDFLKMDVEGAELDLLRGASRLLGGQSRPVILCELADVRAEPWGYRCVEVFDCLTPLGFDWFSIEPDGRLRPCPRKDRFHENLIAIPGERRTAVGDLLIEEVATVPVAAETDASPKGAFASPSSQQRAVLKQLLSRTP